MRLSNLIIILLSCSQIYAQSTFKSVMFSGINSQQIKYTKIDFDINAEEIRIEDSLTYILMMTEPAIVQILANDSVLYSAELRYALLAQYISEIYLLDADNNGKKDLMVNSFPVGASGVAANIILTTFILQDSNHFQLSSFTSFQSNGLTNICDVNNDGRYEFVCFKIEQLKDGTFYYIRNIFDLKTTDNVTIIFDGNLLFNSNFEPIVSEKIWLIFDALWFY